MSQSSDALNEPERAILSRIEADPFVSQQDLAAALGLGRSTVATYIAQLVRKGYLLGRAYVPAPRPAVMVIGGAVIDRKYRAAGPVLAGTSNPVTSRRAFGGVGRNVAEVLARVGVETTLVTAVGDDEAGHSLLAAAKEAGIDVSRALVRPGAATAEYVAVLDPAGRLFTGLADMAVFETMTPAEVERLAPVLARTAWVFLDTNMPAEVIAAVFALRRAGRFRLAADAVSVAKSRRLPADLTGLDVLFLNADEAGAMAGDGGAMPPEDCARRLVAAGAGAVVLTLGEAGLIVADGGGCHHVAAVPAEVVDVTGAGDALIAVTLARLLAGAPLPAAVRTGARIAALTVASEASVAPGLSPALIAADTEDASGPGSDRDALQQGHPS